LAERYASVLAMPWLLLVFCWLIATVHPAAAAPSYIDKVYAQMKAAVEPDRTCTRDIQWVISVAQGDPVRWTARQARKRLANGPRTLTVFLAPDAVKGMAILVHERADGSRMESVYLPLVRRIKKFDELGRFEPILNTDLTWADAGVIALGDHTLKLYPGEQHGGKRTYKVEEVLRDKSTFLRVVNWIAADSLLPLERNFYDRTDTLWKVETFLDIAPIEGVPTPQRIRMDDKQAGTFTEVQFANIHYNVDVPDSIFDPARLPQALDQPYWHPAPQ
jgi:hypothetical protein